MTLNQLIILFKDIAARHEQVNDFAAVQDFNIGADNAPNYPILVVNPTGANLPRTDNGYSSFITTFDLQVIDLVNKDNNNELEVLSDAQQILNDIVNEFNTHPYYIDSGIDTIGNIDFEPLRGVYTSDVDGWKISMELESPNKISFCTNPITNLDGFDFQPASVEVTDGETVFNLYPSDKYTCVGAVASGMAYNRPNPSGQMVSYANYDDGWHYANGTYDYTPPAFPVAYAVSDTFTTLISNNAFGNTNRFTDENGLQVYGNDYFIDHLTGLGYYLLETTEPLTLSWSSAITGCNNLTHLTYSDFRLTNIQELSSLFNYEYSSMLGYAPFNLDLAKYFYTSNTDAVDSSRALIFRVNTYSATVNTKTSTNRQVLACRNHYN